MISLEMKCPQLSKPEATAARNQTPSVTERRKNLERNQTQSGTSSSGQTNQQFNSLQQSKLSLYSPYREYAYEEIIKKNNFKVWEKKKTKILIKDQHRWVCVCGSDTDSDGLLIELFLLTNAWTSIIIESNGFIYMIVFQMHVWRCSFRSSSEQLQDQFSHRDSDWPRFLYDSSSLCEHTITRTRATTCSTVKTLTVIMSSIFSLDSTDGQSEITVRSTATESRWSSWRKHFYIFNQEFRSFSRFLWIPE